MNRSVNRAIKQSKIAVRGSGKSGKVEIDAPDQVILERAAVQLTPNRGPFVYPLDYQLMGDESTGRKQKNYFSMH